MSQVQIDAVVGVIRRASVTLGVTGVLIYPLALIADDGVINMEDRAAFLEFLLAVEGMDDDEFEMAVENGLHDVEKEALETDSQEEQEEGVGR